MVYPLTNRLSEVSREAVAERWREGMRAKARGYRSDNALAQENFADQRRRLEEVGPLPGLPTRRQPQESARPVQGYSPSIQPSADDPNRAMDPLGRPNLRPEDMIEQAQGPTADGVGGPPGGLPPQDELAEIEAELARRQELDEIEQELSARESNLDPLAPPGRQPTSQDQAKADYWKAGKPSKPQPWNETAAELFDKAGSEFVSMLGGGNPADIRTVIGNLLKGSTTDIGALAFRDPQAAFETIDPAHQGARAYGAGADAINKLAAGDLPGAGESAYNAAIEGGSAVLGVAGLRGVPKPAGSAKAAVRETGKGLAGIATDAPVRPQAIDALTRVLTNSGIPRDRIVSGLGRVVDLAKEATGRAATVAQLLQREFGEEFPQVIDNIETVLRERSLTRGKRLFGQADQSPSIVRETAQDMRSTQVPFIEQSADRNLGGNSRMASRDEIAADLKRIGDTAYEPLLAAGVDAPRTERIWNTLLGPGMGELGKPLRQIAAGEGVDIDTMIQNEPVRAAHWMQHKARLLAEENRNKGNTTLANAYDAMRMRVLQTIDDIPVPNQSGRTYKDIRTEYGDVAGVDAAMNMGDQFASVTRNPEKMDNFIRSVGELSPEQRSGALLSVRDWVKTQLRGAPEDAPARLGVLSSRGVLQALDNLGPEGQALAKDIRAIRSESRFLDPITNFRQSATIPNAQALAEGPGMYSRGGVGGAVGNALADVGLMTAGVTHAPIVTALKEGPKLFKGIMTPRIKTLEDMTRVLMARQKGGNALAPSQPPPPKGPPAGGVIEGGFKEHPRQQLTRELEKSIAKMDSPNARKFNKQFQEGKITAAEMDWLANGGTREGMEESKRRMLSLMDEATDEQILAIRDEEPATRMALSLLAERGNARAKTLNYVRTRALRTPAQVRNIWGDMDANTAKFDSAVGQLRSLAGDYGDEIAVDTAREVARLSGNDMIAKAGQNIKTADEAYAFLYGLNRTIREKGKPQGGLVGGRAENEARKIGADKTPDWARKLINQARMREGPFARKPDAAPLPNADVVPFGKSSAPPPKGPPAGGGGAKSGAQKMGNLGKPWSGHSEKYGEPSPVRHYFGELDSPSYIDDAKKQSEVIRRIDSQEYNMETVRLEDITAGGQDGIDPTFRNVPTPLGFNKMPVVLVRDKGRLIIEDGNHRLTAAAERGDKTMKVAVIDLDANPAAPPSNPLSEGPPKTKAAGNALRDEPPRRQRLNTRASIKDAPEEYRRAVMDAPEGISQAEWDRVRKSTGNRLPSPDRLYYRIREIELKGNPTAAELRELKALQTMRARLRALHIKYD